MRSPNVLLVVLFGLLVAGPFVGYALLNTWWLWELWAYHWYSLQPGQFLAWVAFSLATTGSIAIPATLSVIAECADQIDAILKGNV